MASYKLVFKRLVTRDLRDIPNKDVARILRGIERLAKNPRPRGCEKLSEEKKYRKRQGAYRIIYQIEDDALLVVIVKVGRRSKVYRRR